MKTPELIVLESSSAGNGYIIDCGSESLVLELGLEFKEYNMDFSKIAGAFVTHIHHDHLRGTTARKFVSLGVPVFGNESVCGAVQGAKEVKAAHKYKVGFNFLVQPIPVTHSVPTFAYVIDHPDTGRIVFATDCASFNYRIPYVAHWVIEANYSADIVVDRSLGGDEMNPNTFRHLPFESALETVQSNYGTSLQTVTFIHLSDSNSDAELFQTTAQRELCLDNVFIADKGMRIPLNKTDF